MGFENLSYADRRRSENWRDQHHFIAEAAFAGAFESSADLDGALNEATDN